MCECVSEGVNEGVGECALHCLCECGWLFVRVWVTVCASVWVNVCYIIITSRFARLRPGEIKTQYLLYIPLHLLYLPLHLLLYPPLYLLYLYLPLLSTLPCCLDGHSCGGDNRLDLGRRSLGPHLPMLYCWYTWGGRSGNGGQAWPSQAPIYPRYVLYTYKWVRRQSATHWPPPGILQRIRVWTKIHLFHYTNIFTTHISELPSRGHSPGVREHRCKISWKSVQ